MDTRPFLLQKVGNGLLPAKIEGVIIYVYTYASDFYAGPAKDLTCSGTAMTAGWASNGRRFRLRLGAGVAGGPELWIRQETSGHFAVFVGYPSKSATRSVAPPQISGTGCTKRQNRETAQIRTTTPCGSRLMKNATDQSPSPVGRDNHQQTTVLP